MHLFHFITDYHQQLWISFVFYSTLFLYNIVGGIRVTRNQLSESILHYEPIEYEREAFIANHLKIERTQTLHLDFKAYDRTFNLRLRRDTSLFTHDLHIEYAEHFHPSNVYEGYIQDEPLSSVHGFIYDGIFEGSIHTQDDNEFHVESVKQYKHLDNTTIHSVIYNANDIVHKGSYHCGGKKATTIKYSTDKSYNGTTWYNIEESTSNNEFTTSPVHMRERRETSPTNAKECHLFIRADHTYVKFANNDNSRALYLLSQHVKRVNQIYKSTDFDSDQNPDQYTLNIKRIGVIDTSQCKSGDTSTTCQFKPSYIGVEKFLDIVSLDNHDQYCLSYVFAHRDFSDGVLGLAWIGDANGAGGICEPYQSIGGIMKSLNTGIVSNLNYGKTVPTKVTDVTLAHEIGHNFGSQHDPTSGSCAPGGSSGNYIMYPRATSGSAGNNNKFSDCSISYMWAVLKAKAPKCFKAKGEAICGNMVVEKGEECDCGYQSEESCTIDTCCEGAPTGGGTGGCKYTSKAMGVSRSRCSPSNGICCDGSTCKPYTRGAGKECSTSGDCAQAAKCNSISIECPKSEMKQDKALCNNESNTCINGECSGSLCLIINKMDCQCEAEVDHCNVCCQDIARTENCTAYRGHVKEKIKRPPGAPCNIYQGYCDILNMCRKVDAEGPLSRLKKWIFSSKSFDTILDWMKTYWWACILIVLGLVVLMVAFIVCCSVHTPSNNPNKSQPRTLTLSRRGPRSTRPTAPPPSAPGTYSRPPPGYDTAVRENRRPQQDYDMR